MYRYNTREYLEAVVARALKTPIDDWGGYAPATAFLEGPCPIHGEACGTTARRWAEFLALAAVVERFRGGGPLRHEPYLGAGLEDRHVLLVKNDQDGCTYAAGAAGDLDMVFGRKTFNFGVLPPFPRRSVYA